MGISTLISKVIGDKRRWRAYLARKKDVPEPYRDVLEAVQRYVFRRGPTQGDAAMSLLEDYLEVVERAAADGTPIRDLVGDDPVEFAEGFIRNYAEADWIATERTRLTESIERAEQEQQ